jgi:hypothetical protein
METFETFCKNKQLETKPVDNNLQSKKGFFRTRMNKDNFWNLSFLISIISSVGCAELIAKFFTNTLVLPFTIPTFLLSIYFCSHFNPVTFDKDSFISKTGLSFKQKDFWLPQSLIAIAILNIAFIVFPFFLLEGKILFTLLITNIVGWFLLVPVLYCILKNIPIAVFFKKEAWVGDYSYSEVRKPPPHHQFSQDASQLQSPYNIVNNPMHRHLAQNRKYR